MRSMVGQLTSPTYTTRPRDASLLCDRPPSKRFFDALLQSGFGIARRRDCPVGAKEFQRAQRHLPRDLRGDTIHGLRGRLIDAEQL